MEAGADTYYAAWGPVDLFGDREPVVFSPTIFARKFGIEAQWETALRACGYNPAEVYAKDECRRREFLRFHRAKSSAVDVEEVVGDGTHLRMRTRKLLDDESGI